MTALIGRRQLLTAGAAAASIGLLPRSSVSTSLARAQGVRLFDPRIPGARELAHIARYSDTLLIALEGDPVRFWRELILARPQRVTGFTRWSDFVVFRGLAAEHLMRVRRERDLSSGSGGSLFAWELA